MENSQTALTVKLNRHNINILGVDGPYVRYEYQHRVGHSTRWTKTVYLRKETRWEETVEAIIKLVQGVRAEVEHGDYR